MLEAIRWLLIPSLLTFAASAQDNQKATAEPTTGKQTLIQALLDADEADRPAALIAVIEEQIATRVVFATQYDALRPVTDTVLPLVTRWLDEAPEGAADGDVFRASCINVLRDLIKGDGSEALMKQLKGLAEDVFEAQAVRRNSAFALAQFGDRSLIDAQIEQATKQTSGTNIQQQFNGWNTLADIQYNVRDYDAAVIAYRHAIDILEKANQRGALTTMYYNCACSLALGGHTDDAIGYIEKVLEDADEAGLLRARQMLDTDMDIASLREVKRFQDLLVRYFGESKADGTGKIE